jgi:molybdopterin synthase sulfur carrier subunit
MYFASFGEITGLKEEEIRIPVGSRVEELMEAVKELHSQLQDIERILVAVNGKFAEPGLTLEEEDIVALFPPVSGG